MATERSTASDLPPPWRLKWRRRGRAGVLAGSGLLVLAAAAGTMVYASPILGVRELVVEGVAGPEQERVRALVPAQSGTPLARVDRHAVATAVSSLPDLQPARVERRWPSTLAVVVEPRVPVALVREGAAYVVLDGTGRHLRRVPTRPATLPLIIAGVGTGQAASISAGLSVLAELPAEVSSALQHVGAREPADVTLRLSGARRVRWGDLTEGSAKAATLRALLAAEQQAGLFDVSAPTAPAVGQGSASAG